MKQPIDTVLTTITTQHIRTASVSTRSRPNPSDVSDPLMPCTEELPDVAYASSLNNCTVLRSKARGACRPRSEGLYAKHPVYERQKHRYDHQAIPWGSLGNDRKSWG